MKIETLVKTLSFLFLLASLSACDVINNALPPSASSMLQPVVPTQQADIPQPSAVLPAAAAAETTAQPSTAPTILSTLALKPADPVSVLQSSRFCDRIAPGLPIDVTVPDGHRVQPGQVFSKTWRLVNSGDCAWSRDYSVVFFSGQPMGMAGQQMISSEVLPGESVDITVDMVAPEFPGSYQSNWKMRNRDGQLFGLGPNGDSPFWVQIEVVAVEGALAAVPAPAATPTLPVYSSGMISLLPADRLDLDSGSLNQDDTVDVAYIKEEDAAGLSFNPANGARLFIYGSSEPDEIACQSGDLGLETVELDGVETGVYMCYRTSQGLPGFLHVIRKAPEEDTLSLDFVTWTVP